jgi:hypothetical protein
MYTGRFDHAMESLLLPQPSFQIQLRQGIVSLFQAFMKQLNWHTFVIVRFLVTGLIVYNDG